MAGDAHLARQALPHGEEVGLLPRGQTHVQVLPGELQGHEQPLPDAGNHQVSLLSQHEDVMNGISQPDPQI